eukprot:9227552-Pyramimonas_sp.AAC.1
MKEITREWINDCGPWMNAEKAQGHERLRSSRRQGDSQKVRQLRRSAFSAYLFQTIGSKRAALQHPTPNLQSYAVCGGSAA